MSESIAQAVETLVSGDMSALQSVRTVPHEQMLAAVRDKHLVVKRCATVKVLRNLAACTIAPSDAQAWASFVREGYVAGLKGPVQPLPIDYETEFEDAIVEAVGRMDEIGDAVDGTLDDGEIQNLLVQLDAESCP